MKEKKKIVINKKMFKMMKRTSLIIGIAGALLVGQTGNVFAADDPLAVINNLTTLMASIIKAIGIILLMWGIVQVGLALKSHDASQRANRFSYCCRRDNDYFCKTNS